MWQVVKSIFGSGDIIEKGVDLIDEAFYTDSEKAEDNKEMIKYKAENKIRLLEAYAPFKIAQRYIAIVFLFCFTISFFGILIMTGLEIDTAKYLKVIDAFNIEWIMFTIVSFYFGGGFMESLNKKKGEK